MKKEKILTILFLVNGLGIITFWTLFLFNHSESIDLELIFHIINEYLLSIACIVSSILIIKKIKNSFKIFTAGLLFYSSFNSIGWAILNNNLLYLLMILNVVIIGIITMKNSFTKII